MAIVQLSMFDGKVCTKCKEWKHYIEFGKSQATKDGHRIYCFDCRSKRNPLRNQSHTLHDSHLIGGKKCTKCRKWKLVSAFNPRSDNGKLRPWCIECNRFYKQQHRDQSRAMYSKTRTMYYATHKDQIRVLQKKLYDADPIKFRANQHKSRVKRQSALVGSYTTNEWTALCEWFGEICLACKQTKTLTVDHVVPIFHGGHNIIANLQPLCESCNKSKHTKSTDHRDPDRLAAFLEHIKC